ncbi:DEAD/DEAH box helicase [Amycolatopsis sp. NPDC051371]|uniref:DEAD/DEAH box helicase n=1 Tax=Amycolatopsis sp. NPDC051371 TaxID=3155800 RepID=UPI0034348A63
MLAARGSARAASVIISAGAGSGKTLAFYLPLSAGLNGRAAGHRTFALALYPRNELLKDQLPALLEYLDRMSRTGLRTPAISLAARFGQCRLMPSTCATVGPGRGVTICARCCGASYAVTNSACADWISTPNPSASS